MEITVMGNLVWEIKDIFRGEKHTLFLTEDGERVVQTIQVNLV